MIPRNALLVSLVAWVAFLSLAEAVLHYTTEAQWNEYMKLNGKMYATDREMTYARFYYNYNWALVNAHNNQVKAKLRSYSLRVNQFSDLRLSQFNALFPAVAAREALMAAKPPATLAPPESFSFNSIGLDIEVEDQGTVCNSGWAYAAAKSMEILAASQGGIRNIAVERLSAQNLIDCAGGSRSCRNQDALTAFEYVADFNQVLQLEAEYPNRKTDESSGMCMLPKDPNQRVLNLGAYATIPDGDDETLKRLVGSGLPVVVEINPTTFEFMHYGGGVFDPPATRTSGSHYMVVVGYNTTADGIDYWSLQNSFGPRWGESGLIRWKRDPAKPITKNAILPTELA